MIAIVRPIILILSGLLLIAGCGPDQTVDTNIDEGSAGGSISVHVSDGDPMSRPIYTWSYVLLDGSSDISAMKLTVARVSDPAAAVWAVQSNLPTQDDIRSPVTHGTVPQNAFPAVETEKDLQTDVWYRVTVTKADLSLNGYREFLIKP